MKSAGKARSNGLYRHIRTSKEIIRNLLNDYIKVLFVEKLQEGRVTIEEAAEDAGMTVEEFKKVMEYTSLQAV